MIMESLIGLAAVALWFAFLTAGLLAMRRLR